MKDSNKKLERSTLSFTECIRIIIITFIVVSLMTKFVIANIIVPSGSMLDTINIDDRIIADRLVYKLTGINRGDIIIFDMPDNGDLYIKRVIGLPGETIEGKNGYIYVDGNKLTEAYVKDKLNENFGPYTIPEDSYFMMGDNRTDSHDSRYWNNKFVSSDKILGRALFRYNHGFKVFEKQDY